MTTSYTWKDSGNAVGFSAQEIGHVIPHSTLQVSENMQPGNIVFFDNHSKDNTELLRISADGVTANPDVPVDEIAKRVFIALNGSIKEMVRRKWTKLTPDELRDCYAHALENDLDLADVIYQSLVDKHNLEFGYE